VVPGAWIVILAVALVGGTSAGAYARAVSELGRRTHELSFHQIEGRIVRVDSTASGLRLTLTNWRLKSEQLELEYDAPVQVRTSIGHAARGQEVAVAAAQAGSGRGTRSYVGGQGVVFAADDVIVTGVPDRIGRIRAAIRSALQSAGGDAAPLLYALVLGDSRTVDPELMMQFGRSGTLHLLALSGMHLGVLALVAGSLGRAIGGPRLGLALTALVVVGYIALVGMRAGLLRAALLIAIVSFARSRGRRIALADALAAAFLLHLCIDPVGVRSVGFQLSYLSLAGIATVTPVIRHLLVGRMPDLLLAPIAAGVGAQLLSLPVVLSAFGRLSIAASVASMVMAPMVMILMVSGMVGAAIVFAVPRAAILVRPLLEGGVEVLGRLGGVFARGPTMAVAGKHPSLVGWATAAALALFLGALAVRCRFAYHPKQLWRGRI
jgi:ComEC/Rec2-related protein